MEPATTNKSSAISIENISISSSNQCNTVLETVMECVGRLIVGSSTAPFAVYLTQLTSHSVYGVPLAISSILVTGIVIPLLGKIVYNHNQPLPRPFTAERTFFEAFRTIFAIGLNSCVYSSLVGRTQLVTTSIWIDLLLGSIIAYTLARIAYMIMSYIIETLRS